MRWSSDTLHHPAESILNQKYTLKIVGKATITHQET